MTRETTGNIYNENDVKRLNNVFSSFRYLIDFNTYLKDTEIKPKHDFIGIVLNGEGEFSTDEISSEFLEEDVLLFSKENSSATIKPKDKVELFTIHGKDIVDKTRVVAAKAVEKEPATCGPYRKTMKGWNIKYPINIHHVPIYDSTPHYHRKLTEIYLVQRGNGKLFLEDVIERDEREIIKTKRNYDPPIPLRKGSMVIIPSHIIHYANGNMLVNVLAIPGFIPGDEVKLKK